MPEFLSPEWIDDLVAAAEAAPPTPDGEALVLQQVVTGRAGGEVAWWVQVGDGRVVVGAGRADDPTVTFTQDSETAAAVHRGDLSAQAAFMTGRLKVAGDVRVLLDRQGLLAALDDVFAAARSATTY